MPLSKAAQKRIQEKARDFLGSVKAQVADAKRDEIVSITSAAAYDSAAYITGLTTAAKAQRILNRVRAAVAEGRLDPSALDAAKVREIAGDALSAGGAAEIMQTVLRSAYAAGRYEFQQEDASRPYLIYRTMRDRRVRPEHRGLEGLMLPANDPAWSKLYPPNGHGCRCRVDALTVKQAAYLQVASKRVQRVAPVDLSAHTSPGFDMTPSARAPQLQQYLDERMRKLSSS